MKSFKVGDQFTLRSDRIGAVWVDMTYGLVYQIIRIQGGRIYWCDDDSDERGTPIEDFPTDFAPIRVQYNPIDPNMLDRGDHVVCVAAGGDPFAATTPGNHYQIVDVGDEFVCWFDDEGESCSDHKKNLVGKFALAGSFTILGRPIDPPIQLGNTDTVSEIISPPVVEDVGFGAETIQYLLSRHNIHVEGHHARAIVKVVVAMGEALK